MTEDEAVAKVIEQLHACQALMSSVMDIDTEPVPELMRHKVAIVLNSTAVICRITASRYQGTMDVDEAVAAATAASAAVSLAEIIPFPGTSHD